jgi:Phage integrase, N-terminal SAM-like domain
VTHLRQIMLEELERRNYAPGTIRCYIRTVEHFARHFHRPPDQLGSLHQTSKIVRLGFGSLVRGCNGSQEPQGAFAEASCSLPGVVAAQVRGGQELRCRL